MYVRAAAYGGGRVVEIAASADSLASWMYRSIHAPPTTRVLDKKAEPLKCGPFPTVTARARFAILDTKLSHSNAVS